MLDPARAAGNDDDAVGRFGAGGGRLADGHAEQGEAQSVEDQQQGAAEELVQIAVVAYREGEVGILELLDAARTASRARTRSIDLRLEARLAQIALERAVGDTLWP